MKAYRKFLFTVLGIAVLITSLSPVGILYATQLVNIPYAVSGSGWWSGIAITNLSGSDITPIVYISNSDGTEDCVFLPTIKSGEIYAELIENIIPSFHLTDRVSISVANNSSSLFGVTLFVGDTNGGFGFQEFLSEDRGGVLFTCLPTL